MTESLGGGGGGADRVPGLGGLMACVPPFPRKAKTYRTSMKPVRCFTPLCPAEAAQNPRSLLFLLI